MSVAFSRIVAASLRRRARFVRRRRDAAAARDKIRRENRRAESLGKRRIAKSDAKFQGARDGGGGLDGEISRRNDSPCPRAGNAGGALAAYAARAGLEAHIFMPRDTPRANIIECGDSARTLL